MLWKELSGTVSHAKDRFPPPSLLLIQLGSNDLTEIKTVELVNNITSDSLRIPDQTATKLQRCEYVVC
jgi:hypothetical protein